MLDNGSRSRRSRLVKRTRKLRRTVFIIPSLFTVGNIFAGFYSVISTYHGEYNRAALAIVIAVILERVEMSFQLNFYPCRDGRNKDSSFSQNNDSINIIIEVIYTASESFDALNL